MTEIIINGLLGRMGREIATIVEGDAETSLVGGVELPSSDFIGKDSGEILGFGANGVPISDSVDNAISDCGEIIIDFTVPQSTLKLLDSIKSKNIGVVIGTTGFTDEEIARINEVAKSNAVLMSPNMSLGVNFLFYLTKIASEKLGSDFDIEIVEAHHRFKKDAPSGTAKRLGEIAAEAIGQSYDSAVKDGRSGICGERTPKEIGMHAVRGGDIVGDHTVLFAGLGERIELRHVAHSRKTFAQGAVIAAKWLSSKKPGFYSMSDLMEF